MEKPFWARLREGHLTQGMSKIDKKRKSHLHPGTVFIGEVPTTLRRVSPSAAGTEPGVITTPASNRITSSGVSLSLLRVNEYIYTITRGKPPEHSECFREHALPLFLAHYLQQLITNPTPPDTTALCLLGEPSQRAPLAWEPEALTSPGKYFEGINHWKPFIAISFS